MPFFVVRDDITRMARDAVVDPTDSRLSGSGSVDAAIHRAAGPRMRAACDELCGVEAGGAKATPGFGLPAKYVIHAVGPVWKGGGCGEEETLRSCWRSIFREALRLKAETLAVPLISTGTYGFPRDLALDIAEEEIAAFLEDNEMTVELVVFDRGSLRASSERFGEIRMLIDDAYADGRIAEYDRVFGNSRRMGEDIIAGAAKSASERDMSCPAAAQDAEESDDGEGFIGRLAKSFTKKKSVGSAPRPKVKMNAPKPQALEEERAYRRPMPLDEDEEFRAADAEALPDANDGIAGKAPEGGRLWDDTEDEAEAAEAFTLFSAPDLGGETLKDALRSLDESFSQMLLRKIDEKGMKDPECYKRANVDRKLFSKIRSDAAYKPKKTTAVAFAIALELPYEEACELLMKAGFAFSPASKADIIISYFIKHRIYDIYAINETLFEYDQTLLGA